MKVLIISTFEIKGGAAVAANRLLVALRKSGIEANMLVLKKQSDRPFVQSLQNTPFKQLLAFLFFVMERLSIFILNGFNKKQLYAVSFANTGFDLHRHPLVQEADIIHFHWINQGLTSIHQIQALKKTNKPICWTMHDMWCFSGICHYSGDCQQYENTCKSCPFILRSPLEIAQKYLLIKKEAFKNIHFIGVSDWISALAKKSTILRHNTISSIPNPIDTEVFKPMDKAISRAHLGLAQDKNIVLFAAAKVSDPRKGFQYALEAIKRLDPATTAIAILGEIPDEAYTKDLQLEVFYLGYKQKQEDIAEVYSAADVFITPSLEDNLPNTIVESLSCGTPCVGFEVGGIPQLIDHQKNGYLAAFKSSDDLFSGIQWCLEHQSTCASEARKKIMEGYSEKVITQKLLSLYESEIAACKVNDDNAPES